TCALPILYFSNGVSIVDIACCMAKSLSLVLFNDNELNAFRLFSFSFCALLIPEKRSALATNSNTDACIPRVWYKADRLIIPAMYWSLFLLFSAKAMYC